MKFFKLAVFPAAALLNLLLLSPAQAAYVCTGVAGPTDPSTPYFDGNLTDSRCDISEVEAALGLVPGSIDESLIIGSKTDSLDEDPITMWNQDQFGLGTLTVDTDGSNTSGTWILTGGTTEALFFVDKYDAGYDIFLVTGDPFSDSWDDSFRGTIGANCSEVNCMATTSHISVYGVVPIPAAVWLFGTGLLGLVGIARRKRA